MPRNESLIKNSGQLQIDIDGLSPERAKEVKDLLAKDPHIEVSFLSPSRHGVKAAMLIPRCSDDREHKQAFLASKNYLEKTYRLKIDKSCKDVRRVCFLSYDPDLTLNEPSRDGCNLTIEGLWVSRYVNSRPKLSVRNY